MKQLYNADLYVAEYSARQDCFHASTLKQSLDINRKNAIEKRSVDYEIIAIVGSFDDALEVCRIYRSKQARRE